MRLVDLGLTVELCVEAAANEDGARDRVAAKYAIRKSVITNRVARIENFFRVKLFTGPQRKSPTAAGRMMAKYGPRLFDEIEHFAQILQDARERDEVH